MTDIIMIARSPSSSSRGRHGTRCPWAMLPPPTSPQCRRTRCAITKHPARRALSGGTCRRPQVWSWAWPPRVSDCKGYPWASRLQSLHQRLRPPEVQFAGVAVVTCLV